MLCFLPLWISCGAVIQSGLLWMVGCIHLGVFKIHSCCIIYQSSLRFFFCCFFFFTLPNSIPLGVGPTVCLYTHSSAGRHWDCSQSGLVWVMLLQTYLCEQFSVLWAYAWKMSYCFPFYNPASIIWRFQFLPILSSSSLACLFEHPGGHDVSCYALIGLGLLT